MSRLKKLFQILGFWSLIISILPIILFIIAFIIQNILLLKIGSFFGAALLISIIFPFIALGLSIGGLIKDKSKTLAIISLIIIIILILIIIFGVWYFGNISVSYFSTADKI